MSSATSLRLDGITSTPVKGRSRRSNPPTALRRRNQRVETFGDLVRPLALHYARRCQEPWEDLQQVGQLGLIRAAELYRPEEGTPFPAFARPHIRGAILHYLRDVAPSVRLPRRQAELQERLVRLESVQTCPDTSEATAQLRDRLGIDDDRWRLLMRHRQLCRPMPLEEAQLETLSAPQEALAEERHLALRELVDQLEPRQRTVVRQVVLRGWSYRRLAAQMQVSPMTVQRLLHRGLSSLREQLEDCEARRARGGPARSALRGC